MSGLQPPTVVGFPANLVSHLVNIARMVLRLLRLPDRRIKDVVKEVERGLRSQVGDQEMQLLALHRDLAGAAEEIQAQSNRIADLEKELSAKMAV